MNARLRAIATVSRCVRPNSGQIGLQTALLRQSFPHLQPSNVRPFSSALAVSQRDKSGSQPGNGVGSQPGTLSGGQSQSGKSSSDSSSDSSSGSSDSDAPKPKGIKALVQKYGWVALGVYMSLSFVDLPICFVAVHSVGLDKVVEWQVYLKELVGWETKPKESSEAVAVAAELSDDIGQLDAISHTISEAVAAVTPDIEAAVEQQKVGTGELPTVDAKESYWFSKQMWAEFAVAYAIHKSLIFIRLPITAAITPSVVKVLKRWGFKIGVKKPAAKFGVPPSKRQKWWSWWF